MKFKKRNCIFSKINLNLNFLKLFSAKNKKIFDFFENFHPISNFSQFFRTFFKLCSVNYCLRKIHFSAIDKNLLTNPKTFAIIVWRKDEFSVFFDFDFRPDFYSKFPLKNGRKFSFFPTFISRIFHIKFCIFRE